jgi:hypothetical protein
METNNLNKLEKISMIQEALAMLYSKKDLTQYFPKKEHLTLDIINSFVEENLGKLYFDISNLPISIDEKHISRNLIAIFKEEDKEKFLELMRYANPDLSPIGHILYSEESQKKIFEKRDSIHKNLKSKGQRFSISKINFETYSFIPLSNKGFSIEYRDGYLLKIKDKSQILNELWFRNGRIIYTIKDKVR